MINLFMLLKQYQNQDQDKEQNQNARNEEFMDFFSAELNSANCCGEDVCYCDCCSGDAYDSF